MLNTTDTVQHKTARPSSLNIRRDVARNVLTGRCTRQWSVPNIVSCRIKTLAIIRGSRIYFFPILVGAIWFQVALLVKSSQVYFYHTFNVCHYLQITAWTVTANAYSLFVEILFSFSYSIFVRIQCLPLYLLRIHRQTECHHLLENHCKIPFEAQCSWCQGWQSRDCKLSRWLCLKYKWSWLEVLKILTKI